MKNSIPPSYYPERFFQALLIISTLVLSWLGMMIVHEFGHVLFAWATGGKITKVVLYPLEFSRTDLGRNPHPLFVVWGGALVGTILPIAVAAVCRRFKASISPVVQFFAGFCLVVNGIYIGGLSFMDPANPLNVTDTAEMMRDGSPQWVLVLFGAATIPLGFYFWNGLGPYFGLGSGRGKVNCKTALTVSLVLLIVIVTELLFNSR